MKGVRVCVGKKDKEEERKNVAHLNIYKGFWGNVSISQEITLLSHPYTPGSHQTSLGEREFLFQSGVSPESGCKTCFGWRGVGTNTWSGWGWWGKKSQNIIGWGWVKNLQNKTCFEWFNSAQKSMTRLVRARGCQRPRISMKSNGWCWGFPNSVFGSHETVMSKQIP